MVPAVCCGGAKDAPAKSLKPRFQMDRNHPSVIVGAAFERSEAMTVFMICASLLLLAGVIISTADGA
jgi:hypothetical protein